MKSRLFKKTLHYGACFLGAAVLLVASCVMQNVATAACWEALPAESKLQFSVKHEAETINGEFPEFALRFCWAPEKIPAKENAAGKLHVSVSTGLANTNNSLRDAALTSKIFLYTEKYPQAVYHAEQFKKTAEGILANGTLTLRGVTRPVKITFTFTAQDNITATLQGHAVLQRLDFGVGQDEWQATDALKNEVKLDFNVVLKSAASYEPRATGKKKALRHAFSQTPNQ